MSKIVIFSTKALSENGMTSAPSIRILEIAKALQKKGHKITIAEKNTSKTRQIEEVNIKPWNKKFENSVNKDFNIAIINIWCNESEFLNNIKIPIIADVTTPTMIEAEIYFSHHFKNIPRKQANHFQEDFLIPSMNLIEKADFFICASERQKWYYYGILQSLGRIGPQNKGEDIILIVPFGISKERKKTKKVIWDKKPELNNKKIILWPGGFFPWFDPETVIKAIAEISKQRKDIALVFVGAYNPLVPKTFIHKNYKKAENLASKLKVLNKQVFFYDWLKFEEKDAMYNNIEAVLITHKRNLETIFSFRTRTIDAISSGIPIITSEGDVLADKILNYGIGLTTKTEDIDDLKKKILKIIDDEEIKRNILIKKEEILKEFLWDNITTELSELCKNLKKINKKSQFSPYKIINDKNELIKIQESEILKNKKTLMKQSEQIGQFKGSVIYPLYKISSSVGKTFKKIFK